MDYAWVIPLSAAVFDFLLCLLVLIHKPRRRLSHVFVLFSATFISWNLNIAAQYYFQEYSRALFWSNVFRYGTLFVPPTVYHVALCLADRWRRVDSFILIGGYLTSSFLCVLNSLGLLVAGLETFSWGFYVVGLPLYSLHSISSLFFVLATIYLVIEEYTATESPRKRLQMKILLVAFAVSLSMALTNFLPVYGIPFFPLGNAGNVFFCGVLTYAIVKHRLMDIDVVITKTMASVLAFVFWLVPLWVATVYILGVANLRLFLLALAIFVASGLVLPQLLRLTESVVRKVLWGQKYDYLQALSQFHKTIVQELNKERILSELADVFINALQVESVAVYLRDSTKGIYEDGLASASNRATNFDLASPFVHALFAQRDPVVREEVALQRGDAGTLLLAESLSQLKGEVCIPLRLQERLTGFIVLGKKRNRDTFSDEDLHLLSTLANEAAIALQNARLYEDLKRSQQLLARADRLAAVGTLAAGLAHEIRNPLVSIHTFTQLLPERLDDPEFRTTFLPIVNGEVTRMSDLINDLMAFARPSPPEIQEVNLHTVLEPIVRLLNGQAKKQDIHLTFSPSALLPAVPADEGQLRQVFMNLLLNALHATPTGGAVSLTTQTLRGHGGKEYCRVAIRDTGIGIPPEYKEQIFDPFFTTKDSGTGLGLFIAHQIVAEHGGYIDVESVVGKGTSFYVYLPYAQAPGIETTRCVSDGEWMEHAQVLMTGTGKR
ncbi:MAG TPA: ATP-binding protein [Candidatus Binatia bacterium]|jgi:signal transduction histidine kinase|nr:ATP-binding protein [Candidatus Binatia bacterium]